jgi:hypothetical protein
MYTILDKVELLTFEEIKNKYDGKWVFMTNCEFSLGSKLLRAIPRVIADKQFEGLDKGVYDAYNDKEQYGESVSYTLYDIEYLIKNITILSKEGVR